MNILIDPSTGRRDQSYRPYINHEDRFLNIRLTSNVEPFNSNLYSSVSQPTCGTFQNYFARYNHLLQPTPNKSISKQTGTIFYPPPERVSPCGYYRSLCKKCR